MQQLAMATATATPDWNTHFVCVYVCVCVFEKPKPEPKTKAETETETETETKMKTQTETEAETPTECGLCPIRCGGPSTAAARTLWPAHAPLYGHGNASISVSESKWGVTVAPHARIVARPRPSPWPLSSRHLARINFRPTRSLSPISVSARVCPALVWSGLVCRLSARGFYSDPEAERVRATFTFDFYGQRGNWR